VRLVRATCLAIASLWIVGIQPAAAAGNPACFGAAAMDPSNHCTNTTRSVVPKLKDVDVEQGSPCGFNRQAPDLVCTFGTPRPRANREVALVGDSHALHWRAALDHVAQAKGWHAFSITTPGCILSEATSRFQKGIRGLCVRWYRAVQAWFARHREISIVFVSQRIGTTVLPRRGQSELEAQVAGYRGAWARLPPTVTRIVVIRDIPKSSNAAHACVRRVIIAGRRRPGQACRSRRAVSVMADPAVLAVLDRPSARFGYVDLTDYFCSHRYCFPVIGGVLVYRDDEHMTAAYSRTLGPLLLRKVNGRLAAS
jgi:hypothetical protein